MRAHTNGPWVVNFDGGSCFIEDAHGNTIARASHPFPFTTTDDERNANAKLIAAAPDLLAMLCSCRTILIDAEGYSEQGALVRLIDDAITKAGGRS